VRVGAPAAAADQGLADRADLALISVERTRMPMVIADARRPDYPIVLANQAFLDLTGYAADEIIGRNCRFLQCPETDASVTAQVRTALAEQRTIEVELLNQRKNGTTFWNQLYISPVHDEAGDLAYIFASQRDVTERRRAQTLEATERRLLREVDHRAMNAMALVQGIVRLTRADTVASYAASIQARVATLARTHAMLAARGWSDISLAEVIASEIAPYGLERFIVEGPELLVAASHVQALALALHEIGANAARHGSLAAPEGRVDVRWSADVAGQQALLSWAETGQASAPPDSAGFGGKMIDAILKQQLRGAVRRQWAPDGLKLEMTFPARPREPIDSPVSR
jgi:PAS domain S-box-containing protein